MRPRYVLPLIAAAAMSVGCTPNGGAASGSNHSGAEDGARGASWGGNAGSIEGAALTAAPFTLTEVARFSDPWAIAFLPGDNGALVTEKGGRLMWWRPGGAAREVAGAPRVAVAGQGGLGDVVLDPDFATNRRVWLSWAAAGEGQTRGAVVGHATLSADMSRITGLTEVWRQVPFVTGAGHYGHRIAFGPDGKLYISSGERQKFDPAQDRASNLGKVVRLNRDGSVPADNPFAREGGVTAQLWSTGHRNPLGLAFTGQRLWVLEMGPQGGDELNLIRRGANYGYPLASNGDHYDGRVIPDHREGDGFAAPALWWNPAISPGSLHIVGGQAMRGWQGTALIGALGGTGLVQVAFDGDQARQVARWNLDMRIRAIGEASDGTLYLVEDGGNRGQGRLFRLAPRG